MLDPSPAAPSWLSSSIASTAESLSFPTLPLHIHQVIASFLFYQFVQTVVSPCLSSYLFPNIYPQFKPTTKTNWDVHVVSLVQSCSINAVALWVMWADEERRGMSSIERVYGYTGGCGLIQGLAAGYFLWDLVVTSRNVGIFGLGMWAHAVCALCVFSFGFRPFLSFYGPTFILYELSSPFLNIHWFLDKVHLTGSRYQWYNGLVLLGTFFACRLIWGTYQSIRVYQDVWAALHLPVDQAGRLLEEGLRANITGAAAESLLVPRDGGLCLGRPDCVKAQTEIMRFVNPDTQGVPVWLAATYLTSNTVLNSLNFYWFGKMIEAVRKRFDGSSSKNINNVTIKDKKDQNTAIDEQVNHKSPMAENESAITTALSNKNNNNNTIIRRRASSIILDAADALDRENQIVGVNMMDDAAADADADAAAATDAGTALAENGEIKTKTKTERLGKGKGSDVDIDIDMGNSHSNRSQGYRVINGESEMEMEEGKGKVATRQNGRI